MKLPLRLTLARAPGLRARHLQAALAMDASHSHGDRRDAAARTPAGPDSGRNEAPDTKDLGDLIPRLLHLKLPPRARAWLAHPDPGRIDADLRWEAANGCRVLTCLDREYPRPLLDLRDAPAVLFVLGDAAVLSRQQVAVVGARAASSAGCATSREFAAQLAQSGFTVTSGLAVGIDAAAHEGALDAGGASIAVCASGLDRIQPPCHRELAERLVARGALLSEQPPTSGTLPHRALFPLRNRLIGALALGTVVVEAAARSGSLHTARTARRLGRRVFAVPGSIRDPLHRGCHQLIREGASLAAGVDDIFSGLGVVPRNQYVMSTPIPRSPAAAGTGSLDKAAEMLLDAAGFEPVGIDFLVERTGLSGAVIASLLLVLELRGRVVPHPGGRYCRLT